jgi:hypothetical protein
MTERQHSIVIGLAAMGFWGSITLLLIFLANGSLLLPAEIMTGQQPYQGWYGAWVQSITVLLGGGFALGGGFLAYRGAKDQADAAAQNTESFRQIEEKKFDQQQKNADEAWAAMARAVASETLGEIQLLRLGLSDLEQMLIEAMRDAPRLYLFYWPLIDPGFSRHDFRTVIPLGYYVLRLRRQLTNHLIHAQTGFNQLLLILRDEQGHYTTMHKTHAVNVARSRRHSIVDTIQKLEGILNEIERANTREEIKQINERWEAEANLSHR